MKIHVRRDPWSLACSVFMVENLANIDGGD